MDNQSPHTDDALRDAEAEIARLQLRLALYAQLLQNGSGADGGLPHAGLTALAGAPRRSKSKSQSLKRSLKMVGYIMFPFNKRRKTKRRMMMAALWP
ncbi:MAG: hypothetical protein KDA50_09540 [Rhodobacteraceae bacterium]|nr:hypothetical protein [Paracoccaceae bacterium]